MPRIHNKLNTREVLTLSVARLEVDGRPRVREVGYDQVGSLDLRDDSGVDVVVVLYAIDALCIDSRGPRVFLTALKMASVSL
jgi:hypothetical protein